MQTVEKLKISTQELETMEQKWVTSQQVIASMEEELTQCRAHSELYKLQFEEEVNEKESVKVDKLDASPLMHSTLIHQVLLTHT